MYRLVFFVFLFFVFAFFFGGGRLFFVFPGARGRTGKGAGGAKSPSILASLVSILKEDGVSALFQVRAGCMFQKQTDS